ncbi:MAG: phosphatidylserine decarboxylase family protein [Bacteroidales bacterium]|nr:phosphatidylserine decarboxylase family protein [Bacteroidales bacterium]
MKRIVRIHREGLRLIIVVLALLIVLVAILSSVVDTIWVKCLLYLCSLFFFGFVVRFFRVPRREIEKNEKAIYAPADGKIVVIEEIDEETYFHEKRLQISIFMSPLNVHVNSYPISGNIVKSDYYPGKHVVAWYPKSSMLNEHTSVIIENERKEQILVRQIAGAVARRIVCNAKEGTSVEQGAELGIIKLGSRVDVLLPVNVSINVELGESVRSKQTVLAYFD